MRKIILLGLLVVVSVFGSGYAYANGNEDSEAIAGGGMDATFVGEPDEYKTKFRAAAGGGDFSCGVNGFKVWASYSHGRLTHSATAKNGWGGSVRDKQRAGRRAYATCNATLRGNTGWWNIY
ncbi:lactococcin 972 family bacteriocin [Enterococcus faecalis]|uniref:lactococcin 972 family bacteriocin n=1 Tax=Enterococcus TaxID=1350 RepID=UPI0003527FDC|nr:MULTISPECIES: lactococcin 972 family bacteriocin [Enterococcus]EGO6029069.1 lactococcin 972 family bacteriocin [Enterococcus faecalis]EGO6643247.1 lactococcin 972 family bacteriocin [Enterococcus faecalis]EGO8331751.1 lactococcin 972 family bacteriocin [Enterococcus faecalis]EGO8788240.1 lactococcin 972 family bacteriocin [Enterococcus faecalis]EHE8516323.1 lactococcin 972 family bacteriocin [Enterococcus faecalis]